MEFLNEETKKEWGEFVNNNSDMYGSGVVRYAEGWAAMM